MKKIIALLSIVIFSALQTAPTLKLDLTIPETETVLKALSQLPYSEAAPLINKIQLQAQKQLTDTSKNKK